MVAPVLVAGAVLLKLAPGYIEDFPRWATTILNQAFLVLVVSLAAGIVCFEVAGFTPEAVVARLAQRRIHATASPYKVSYARLAAGIMNREQEIDTAITAVRDLAKS